MSKKKSNAGRPSIYTQKLAESILSRVAEGESVRSIARDDAMPNKSTIFDWILNHPEFSVQYEKSRAIGLEVRAEEIEAIAEDPKIDVPRAKLIVDTKKWNLSKLAPKRFGDKINMDLTSKDRELKSLTLKEYTDEELRHIATASESRVGEKGISEEESS